MARKRDATGDGRIELTGRTRGDHIVIFNGDKSLTHQFVTVTILKSDSLTLFGEFHV
jgi:tRNA A37 methylthiotransferase MiaB